MLYFVFLYVVRIVKLHWRLLGRRVRFVFHPDLTDGDCDHALNQVVRILHGMDITKSTDAQ